jgi:predicted RNA-binding Zn ribbon-like protein
VAASETTPDSGTPAPAPLDLVQSLANTLGADPGGDQLLTREDAAVWLRAAGLLPAQARLGNSDHNALLRLRESLRGVLAGHTNGDQDAAASAALTRALADGRIVVTVDPANGVGLASAARASYSGVVAELAVAIAASANAGTWPRLKSCSAAGCGVAFYDDSAAGTATSCAAHAAGA